MIEIILMLKLLITTGFLHCPFICGTIVEQLLTLKQVSEKLQISRTSCWRLISERGLRAVKSGGLVRVRESDLASWIEKNSTAGSEMKSGGTQS